MSNKQLIETLEARITEVEWFGKQHQLRVEPHLYPKGLFHVQNDPVKRYHLSAYIDEFRHDLESLKRHHSSLIITRVAKTLLQKITVIITTFRSQHLRRKSNTNVSSLLGNIDLTSGNAYEYMLKQNQPPVKSDLKDKLKRQTIDIERLIKSRQQKEHQLTQASSAQERNELQEIVLGLAKQIGCLEQSITRIKEGLARAR